VNKDYCERRIDGRASLIEQVFIHKNGTIDLAALKNKYEFVRVVYEFYFVYVLVCDIFLFMLVKICVWLNFIDSLVFFV